MDVKKIIIMGTPDLVVPTLCAIVKQFNAIDYLIISQADKARGRGQVVLPTPVKVAALDLGLTVKTPSTPEDLENIINDFNPSLIIVFAYGVILPKSITDLYYCINIHASILPQYRGASPIQSALLNGDVETGITLIKMNERMDAGDILCIKKFNILPDANFKDLSQVVSNISAEFFPSFLKKIIMDSVIERTPQVELEATYCRKIKKSDLMLFLDEDPYILHNKVRAFFPLAWVQDGKKRLKIMRSKIDNNQFVRLLVQPENKKEMLFLDYINGNPHSLFLSYLNPKNL